MFVHESRLARKSVHKKKIDVVHSVYFSVLSRVTFSRIPSSQIQLHLVCAQYTYIRKFFFSQLADTPAGTG